MLGYIIKRLALVIPTLFGILLINFFVLQIAPGGPLDSLRAKLQDLASSDHSAITQSQDTYSNDLDNQLIEELTVQFHLDKPLTERFFIMVENYLNFDLGTSYFSNSSVFDLILSKMPVSLSLGLWTVLIIYLTVIPLGIKKAVLSGQKFDKVTTITLAVLDGIPSFVVATILLILFASDNFIQVFPLRGMVSNNFSDLSLIGKLFDYLWHMFLPVVSMVITSLAGITFLIKNSFIEELNKQYVVTAYSKGCSQKRVLYFHVFRNALIIIIADLPQTLIAILFTSSLMIEILFSLDGIGLLAYNSALNKDYPVILGLLYIMSMLGLLARILSDILYHVVDPRINFSKAKK